jgi:hypothetical protein
MTKVKLSPLRLAIAAALSLSMFSTNAAFADKAPGKGTGGAAATDPVTPWGGLGWGLGLAANFDVTGKRVANATLVNNIVRVDDATSNVNVGFVLEAHYFLREFTFGGDGTSVPLCIKIDRYCMEVAHGPFVAIQVGGGTSAVPKATDVATAYALGWMVGLRHPNLTTSPTSSWNLGVGVRVDPNTKLLGDGIVANQPLPAGETAIRYKNEPRFGLMLLSSFSF